jgi:hypothetical protein
MQPLAEALVLVPISIALCLFVMAVIAILAYLD